MSGLIVFAVDGATESQIRDHLARCAHDLAPYLASRESVAAYAQKVHKLGLRFEAWAADELIGLVAVYCNDEERSRAFITNVSVDASYRAQGIASDLVARCIEHVADRGFKRIELEVSRKNIPATELYLKRGFTTQEDRGEMVLMALEIGSE